MRLIYPPYNRKQERVDQLVYELITKPDFDFEVEKIRKKFGVKWWLDASGFEEEYGKSFNKFTEDLINDDSFKKLVVALKNKFNLHSGWDDFLDEYILTNESSRDPESPLFEHDNNDNQDDLVFTLKFYPSTTIDDVKCIWKKIRSKTKGKRRVKPWKMRKRDKDIFDLARQGMTAAKIADFIEKKYKINLDYGNIKRIVSDYQKRMLIPPEYRVKNFQLR